MTTTLICSKFSALADLMRLRKQYGTALLVLPSMWVIFIAASGRPSAELVGVFLVGAFLMRSAGCVINDIADRHFDRAVARTKSRPLASGRLGLKAAFALFFILTITAFVLIVLTLNIFTIKLAVIGVLFAVVYPFVKRFSHLPQVFLGVAFGWGAVMAWAAVHETISIIAVLVFAANIFWSTAYDTIYALMDIEDDRRAGVKSTAILFGTKVYSIVALLYVAMLVTIAVAGYMAGLGLIYYAALVLVLIYALNTVSNLKASSKASNMGETAMRAFISNVWMGAVILLAVILDLNFL